MTTDYIYHGRLEGLHIGFSFAVTPVLCSQAVVQHNCDPVSAHLFARALNAGILCMHTLKEGEKLNLHWHYDGALKTILVDMHHDGRIRGLIAPTNLSQLAKDRLEIYGENGHLNVVASSNGRILNSGTVECAMQHVVKDLAYFYSSSMQQESELNVMVKFTADPAAPVSICQGLMLHALPEADLLQFQRVRDRLFHDDVRELLGRPTDADGHFEELLNLLVKEEGITPKIHVEQGPAPSLFCNCSMEKFQDSLRLLSEEDRAEIRETAEPVAVRCEFCSKRYSFSPEQCEEVWSS